VTSGELDEVQVIDPSVGFEPIHRIPLPELWSVGSYQWASFTPIYSEFFGYEPETKTLTIFTYSDLKNEEITGSGPVEKIVISRERSNLHAELFDGKFSIHTGPTVLPGVSFNGELLVNRTGLKSPGEGTHGFGLRDFRPNGLEPAGAMTLSSDDQMVWMATFDGELVAYSLEFLTDELQELLCGTLPALPGSQLPELTDRLGVKWHCQKKLP
jgi:hypothetical protein